MPEQVDKLSSVENLIGIFVSPRQLRGLITNRCSVGLAHLLQAAKKFRINPVWFASNQSKLKANVIQGSLLKEDKKWCTRDFPLPKVVYDRSIFKGENRLKAKQVKKVLAAKGVNFINRKSDFLKWETYKLLKGYPNILPFLPETILLKKTFDLEDMLAAYGQVCVKTNNGSMGREVIFIYKLDSSEYEVIYPRRAPRCFSDFKDLTASLSDFWLNRKCIIQKIIPLASWNDRLFDLRLLMQKIELSVWDCTAMVAKLAPPNKMVTNISQGGTAKDVFSILSDLWPTEAEHLMKEIKDLGCNICQILEENYGLLGEIGLDVALDKEGKIWLIEVNGKPGKSSIRGLEDKKMIAQAYERPLLYAKMLSEESDNQINNQINNQIDSQIDNQINKEKEIHSMDSPNAEGLCGCSFEKEKNITFKPCQDMKEVKIKHVKLGQEGRLLKVRVQLDSVCPGRNVAVGVLLYENSNNTSLLKGFRTCEVKIPGIKDGCENQMSAGEFCFILPEENLCRERTFSLKVIAHYSSFPGFPSCPC